MEKALEDHEVLSTDDEARIKLFKYFTYTAHYIVAASIYMKPDQASKMNIISYNRKPFLNANLIAFVNNC